MSEKQNIEELISQNCLDEALVELDRMLLSQPADAGLLFMRGKLKWRLGDRSGATGDYAAAARIDPSSPAVAALEHARDIENFYNHDLYNP
ncbi:MAG: hypothetical protein K2M02_00070 [Duncaniella sp.]|nr:hypothetical protein [Duncaniella sp.]MDE6324548.1 hypothetical protein [Duncaniella sp.]